MSSTSAINSASDIQMDYMKLLVTELQNQNPLEPLDNNQMASQLAQFSQLQQLESMDANFADVLAITERTYANTLIGKQVSFMTVSETGEEELASGGQHAGSYGCSLALLRFVQDANEGEVIGDSRSH